MRIGITADPGYDVAEYEQAVRSAGGDPIRLLPDLTRLAADVQDLDGLIFSGGEDVDPQRYGAAPHARTETASSLRDDYEFALMRAALDLQLPALAICRGLQVANVALGGSLHQHVPDVFGTSVPHSFPVNGRTYRGLIDQHRLEIDADSRLAGIAGTTLVTGSRHHQAVDRIGAGSACRRACARRRRRGARIAGRAALLAGRAVASGINRDAGRRRECSVVSNAGARCRRAGAESPNPSKKPVGPQTKGRRELC